MSKDKGGRLPDRSTVVRELRHGADLLEHGDVAGAVEDVLEHVGHRHEHSPEPGVEERTPPVAPKPPASAPPPPIPTTIPATVVTTTAAKDGFTCPTPFSPVPADVVVVCCSSEKFELQNQEFIKALGYRMPHFIQVPGGPASLYGLAAISGFLTKAMGAFVDKAVDLVGVTTVVLIAHEDCGAYKAGRISILGQLTRRLTGQGMKEAQTEHLQKAARELQARLGHAVEVQAFYGSIVPSGSQRQIRFAPVEFDSRLRR